MIRSEPPNHYTNGRPAAVIAADIVRTEQGRLLKAKENFADSESARFQRLSAPIGINRSTFLSSPNTASPRSFRCPRALSQGTTYHNANIPNAVRLKACAIKIAEVVFIAEFQFESFSPELARPGGSL